MGDLSVPEELSVFARARGLCGERFGFTGVCDEPAGHEPIAPPHWMHSETISGPVDARRLELYVERGGAG